MANLNDFIMSNIDYVLVVNKDFEIVYNSRFDEKMGNDPIETTDKKYKNLFELYPALGRNNSSIARTMSTGEVVFNDMQEFVDIHGNVYVTQNITFPVFKNGKISGVVELTKDLTTAKHVRDKQDYLRAMNGSVTSFSAHHNGSEKVAFDDILTLDSEMIRAIEQAKLYSHHMNPTLIYGETGTGKELFAQAMINYAAAPKQKIIIQNCAAVPENLIESILFGTTRGSYTGAENRKGLFEEADGGIFFLDELNALPYHVQGKLLRVVQEGTFRPIGSNKEKRVDVKIIAAINIDPMEAIEKNILRKDLFYRFSSSMIYLPPLRERKVDIEYLIDHYIDLFNDLYGKHALGISDALRSLFLGYSWDGNVRELKHVIESMVSLSDDSELDVHHIPLYLHNKMAVIEQVAMGANGKNINVDQDSMEVGTAVPELSRDDILNQLHEGQCDLNDALHGFEKALIASTLRKVNGNKTRAGKLLGIPRQTLKYKMDKLEIQDAES